MNSDEPAIDEVGESRLERFLLGAADDERRHRRIVISVPVRFMLEEGTENRGLLYDMSPGGVSVTSDASPQLEARIVLYIEDIGRVEGIVARLHPYGFAVRLVSTQVRRDKIAERLTLHANRHRMRADDLRLHERVETDKLTRCITPDGAMQNCRVTDLSLTGAAIEIDPPLAIGTEVSIGRMRGKVVRRVENGVAIRFMDGAANLASMQSRLSAIQSG